MSPEFVTDYPHKWALLRQAYIETYIYDSILTEGGWYPQAIWSLYLVDWEDQDDGTIRQTETVCAMDASEIVFGTFGGGEREQLTVVPQIVVDSIAPADWSASLTVLEEDVQKTEECPVQYKLLSSEFGPQYWVMGALLDDPVAQACPSSEDDPTEYDQDHDGHPGITTEQWVDGELNANLYICSRTTYRLQPGTVSEVAGKGYQIQGVMTDLAVDQALFGSDNSMLDGMDPETRWSQNDLTYYILIELPDDATCDDISTELFYQ